MFTLLHLLRAHQYLKNAFIFIPVFFAGKMTDFSLTGKLIILFASFCCISSVVYIVNDICDVNEDRRHPTKKSRPIASGAVTIKAAFLTALILLVVGFTLPFFAGSTKALICLALYLALNLFYSIYAKHRAIIDVVCLALGFVIRVVAGALVAEVAISQWLVLMIFILCVFLALGKRWHDFNLESSPNSDGTVRKSIKEYSRDFLLVLMTFFATMNTICYVIYSILARDNVVGHGEFFYTTSLWVIIGNMRYLQIIFVHNASYSPTQTLFYDPMIRFVVLLWAMHVALFLYVL